MTCLLPLLVSTLVLVAEGLPRVRLESDGSEPARLAVETLQQNVVLLSGSALPETGTAPFLRFELGDEAGYRIESRAGGTVIAGRDPVRAVYDALRSWGGRRSVSLELQLRDRRSDRTLWIESDHFDPKFPATGLALRGLESYSPAILEAVRRAGYGVRIASTSFDDFLAPARFADHPEWFALRDGERVARGNFALTNPQARSAYLDALGAWLEQHPRIHVLGIWPEVTTVWCEESAALGHAEAYALLWREAAARFPKRRFEVLATGLTLRPPRGAVPANVEVRFRPGKEASALQGIAAQEMDAVVRAWEARGARLLLEIDGAPDSWVGMPWPCHDAVRADARRFRAAVMSHPRLDLAYIWRDPDREQVTDPAMRKLLERARPMKSWGNPRDAANLFLEEEFGLAHEIAKVEQLHDRARQAADADALYAQYGRVLERLSPKRATIYRRYRGREIRRRIRDLQPAGVETRIGPALVRDDFDRMVVQTDRLRIEIDRATALVDSVRLKRGTEWTPDLTAPDGGFFSVHALRTKGEPGLGSVRLTSPEKGVLHIELSGGFGAQGIRWESRLAIESASGRVRQTAGVTSASGIALAAQFDAGAFDHWVCPPYATEGRLDGSDLPSLGMPPNTLIYLRSGDRGPGLALRLPRGGTMRIAENVLIATTFRNKLEADWILFTSLGELGH